MRHDRCPIRDGQSKSLLKMCAREQLRHALRRDERDVTCDDDFDASAAPRHHLNFEILAGGKATEPPRGVPLIDRKSYACVCVPASRARSA